MCPKKCQNQRGPPTGLFGNTKKKKGCLASVVMRDTAANLSRIFFLLRYIVSACVPEAFALSTSLFIAIHQRRCCYWVLPPGSYPEPFFYFFKILGDVPRFLVHEESQDIRDICGLPIFPTTAFSHCVGKPFQHLSQDFSSKTVQLRSF